MRANTYIVETWQRSGEPAVHAPAVIDTEGSKMYLKDPSKIKPGSVVDEYGFQTRYR